MLRVCSLAGETVKTFAAEEFEGQSVKSLKTLVAKQIGVPRFRQRWVSEDHAELQEDSLVSASDVQLVVLDFAQAEDGDVRELFDACERNLPDTVEKLLRKPFNPDMNIILKHQYSKTALHVAAERGSMVCLALLLEAGADKDAVFRLRRQFRSVYYKAGINVLAPLSDTHADLERAEVSVMSALHSAAKNGHREVVRLLLRVGANPNVSDSHSITALHLAALRGHQEVVWLLLGAGADKDATLMYGTTALHFAAEYGHLEVVRLLLGLGANKDATQKSGKTARNLAAQNRHQDVVQLLE